MHALAPHLQTIGLFAGIGVVLLVASLIGWTLKLTVAKNQSHGVIDNLNTRIKAWWAMVLVIGIAFMFGDIGIVLLFAFISCVALREFTSLTTRGGDHAALAACFFVVLPVQYVLVYIGLYGLYSIFIPVFAFLCLPVVILAAGNSRCFLERVATLQWGLVLCVFCISHVPALLSLDIAGYEGRNLLLIVFLVLVVQSSDVLQYCWGMLLGKHRMAPALSPSKTWEGLIGGVASATALGAALFWITPFNHPWQAALMALAINSMGFCGGLVMSAIKRDRGVKDWGKMIDGHGGMLDRLNSVAFAAPVFFHLTRFWWT
ncbi:MAG: phosphatidate cytidylyltransferase [Dechloromonas sp.]|uniref:Phosphatidate cytidylyltransferase n=1 Tax=Candidatus Dechloromonas phosphorivorans TaxID=2899244 RepID=A0A9D7LSI5_9RHOO|nr:phosphatidate cytidylyltransferase [Candidatus Dechloromonas phosphorivorans]